MRNMRRDNRARNNSKDAMQNKIIMYSIIGVAVLTVILVALLMYSRSLSEEMQDSAIDFGEMANITSDNNTENTTNTNTESVSTQIGKSVNETENETNTAKNNITSTNTTNSTATTQNQTNTTKTETKKTTQTTNASETKTEETKKELSFEKPVEGEIIKAFAKDNLVYSETLQEWITHLGIDIKADKTTVVKAAEAGTVKTIKNDPRYGLTITIEHDNGYQTVYANLLSSEFVIEGEKVEKGQSIGTVGNTATFEIADESHLHFEILKDGLQIDPSNFIQ